ncbi:MAG: hypothetical protein WC851_02670 [Candidatus Shapirobacteria bacterium]|jgi:hypothetical protein
MNIQYVETKSIQTINCGHCGLPIYRTEVTLRTPRLPFGKILAHESFGPIEIDSHANMVCSRNPSQDHSHAPDTFGGMFGWA